MYAPQPYTETQPVSTTPVVRQELNTKYNPRTGQTFPSTYTYDSDAGEALKTLGISIIHPV